MTRSSVVCPIAPPQPRGDPGIVDPEQRLALAEAGEPQAAIGLDRERGALAEQGHLLRLDADLAEPQRFVRSESANTTQSWSPAVSHIPVDPPPRVSIVRGSPSQRGHDSLASERADGRRGPPQRLAHPDHARTSGGASGLTEVRLSQGPRHPARLRCLASC
jgi:hypothetical protein